jgi:hypothetical protein
MKGVVASEGVSILTMRTVAWECRWSREPSQVLAFVKELSSFESSVRRLSGRWLARLTI